MLFNSYAFMFLFLPVTLALYYALGRMAAGAAMAFLAVASLFFYGWWNPAYLGLLGGSILFNFAVGSAIARAAPGSGARRLLLRVGIVGDLALLGWFKYADFALGTLGAALGRDLPVLGL